MRVYPGAYSRHWAVLVMMVIAVSSAWSAAGETQAAAAIRRATGILNPTADSSAVLEVTEWDHESPSQKSSYNAFFHGQGTMLLRKTLPETDRGRAVLLQENRMWVELPAARRPLVLSMEQRLTSDAVFADLARANFSRDYRIERVTEEAGPPPSRHFFLKALRSDVPYAEAELWLDKASGRPLRARFVSASKLLSKVCEYSSYQTMVGSMRPARFTITDPSRPNWKAELLFTNWVAASVDPRYLEPASLGKEESVTVKPQKPANAPAPARQGDDMALVPAGPFIMGRDNGFPDEQPAHETTLKAFWIDRTEVTVARYRQFLKAKRKPLPHAPVSPSMPRDYFVSRSYSNYPMVDISWNAASEFCKWSGKRLPTEAEWEKAARGTTQRLYPWGAVWDETRANSRENPVSSEPGKMVHFTMPVGSTPANAGPYGNLDMAGNVWEWVNDWYDAYPGSRNQNEAFGRKYRVVRGGSWVSSSLSLLTVARDFAAPQFGYDSIGFRCAKDKNE